LMLWRASDYCPIPPCGTARGSPEGRGAASAHWLNGDNEAAQGKGAKKGEAKGRDHAPKVHMPEAMDGKVRAVLSD
jgi:hypothetical protein